MKKTLKLIWVSLFIIIVYHVIAFSVSRYVGWIIQKSIIWIIIVSLIAIVISRIILNKIPFIIGNINGYEPTVITIASIISWIVRVLYLILIIITFDSQNYMTISNSVFCYLMFLGLGNFFNYGITLHLIKQDNETNFNSD
jgi:hypothetical protein